MNPEVFAMRLALALLLTFFAIATHPVIAADKPNIIYIMCDDLGYGDLGCFGQQRIQTRRLDRLASEGLKLTSYYAGATVCRPSRLCLWTGQHTGHTAIDSNKPYVFKPSDVTVAELLKDAGYTTGGVGKWAMGGVGSPGHPNKQGFDFWMGFLDQSDAHNYYPTHLFRNSDRVPLAGNVISQDPNARGRVATERKTYSHDVMTGEALDFIRRSKDEPFLLHVHWTIPHANNEGGRVTGDGLEVPDYGPYTNEDWPDKEKGFAAMITRMDGDVGRIVDLLKELKLDRKTLIIFTSDNGPHREGGHSPEFFNSSGPLRGIKRDLYDGGIRAPTIAWWPGVIAPGRTSDEPLAGWDFLPTACELAGAEPPKNTDGLSFVPLLHGGDQPSHPALYWQYEEKRAVRMGRYKGVKLGPNKPWELYDLTTDIGEQNNIAGSKPEVVERIEAAVREATAPY
jgi:uncharacterized sulfatase